MKVMALLILMVCAVNFLRAYHRHARLV